MIRGQDMAKTNMTILSLPPRQDRLSDIYGLQTVDGPTYEQYPRLGIGRRTNKPAMAVREHSWRRPSDDGMWEGLHKLRSGTIEIIPGLRASERRRAMVASMGHSSSMGLYRIHAHV
ncbi:hypothetical protein CIB48_g5426 [Xylaria polymorpha]|nr:hypothetical protein CIB48_g5426 [Xylaria polymorpha]